MLNGLKQSDFQAFAFVVIFDSGLCRLVKLAQRLYTSCEFVEMNFTFSCKITCEILHKKSNRLKSYLFDDQWYKFVSAIKKSIL
jgi:hypothetical protein